MFVDENFFQNRWIFNCYSESFSCSFYVTLEWDCSGWNFQPITVLIFIMFIVCSYLHCSCFFRGSLFEHGPIEYDSFLNRSTWPIDRIITGTTTLAKSGPVNNAMKSTLHFSDPRTSSIVWRSLYSQYILASSVTYLPSAELSNKRCTCVHLVEDIRI